MLRSFLFFVLTFYASGYAQTGQLGQVTEYQIKAAYLYNFAKFVEWPAGVMTDSTGYFIIGVLGRDPFGSDLDQTVAGKTVKGRRLLVKRFKNLEDLEFCHILFVGESEKSRISKILDKIKDSSMLTVGEASWFAEAGGIMTFVLRNNKIRFQTNVEASTRAKLIISSRLLRLAEIIGDRYTNGTR